MRYRMILVDFDGTLFDTRGDITLAANRARADFSLPPLSTDTVASYVGNGLKIFSERAFSDSNIDMVKAYQSIREHYFRYPADKSFPYPGVQETLSRLKAEIVIVSNKPKELILASLDKFQLNNRFVEVIGGECLPVKKPDTMAVEMLMERYRYQRHELVMIGDGEPDIRMAKNAGIDSIFCQYGFIGEDKVGANYSVNAFSEVLPLVE